MASDLLVSFIAVFVCGLWFTGARACLKLHEQEHEQQSSQEEKRLRALSWLLGLLASGILTISSPWWLWTVFTVSGSPATLSAWLDGEDALSRALAISFVVSLVADLGVGSALYPRQLKLLTCWVHHIAYIAIVCAQIYFRCTHSFVVMAVCELPTLVLALGSIYPRLRSSELFGLTFFWTRLVYFSAVSLFAWMCCSGFLRQAASIPMLAVHAWWYWAWLSKSKSSL